MSDSYNIFSPFLEKVLHPYRIRSFALRKPSFGKIYLSLITLYLPVFSTGFHYHLELSHCQGHIFSHLQCHSSLNNLPSLLYWSSWFSYIQITLLRLLFSQMRVHRASAISHLPNSIQSHSLLLSLSF